MQIAQAGSNPALAALGMILTSISAIVIAIIRCWRLHYENQTVRLVKTRELDIIEASLKLWGGQQQGSDEEGQ